MGRDLVTNVDLPWARCWGPSQQWPLDDAWKYQPFLSIVISPLLIEEKEYLNFLVSKTSWRMSISSWRWDRFECMCLFPALLTLCGRLIPNMNKPMARPRLRRSPDWSQSSTHVGRRAQFRPGWDHFLLWSFVWALLFCSLVRRWLREGGLGS